MLQSEPMPDRREVTESLVRPGKGACFLDETTAGFSVYEHVIERYNSFIVFELRVMVSPHHDIDNRTYYCRHTRL